MMTLDQRLFYHCNYWICGSTNISLLWRNDDNCYKTILFCEQRWRSLHRNFNTWASQTPVLVPCSYVDTHNSLTDLYEYICLTQRQWSSPHLWWPHFTGVEWWLVRVLRNAPWWPWVWPHPGITETKQSAKTQIKMVLYPRLCIQYLAADTGWV